MDNRQRAHLRILLATAIVWLVASAARAQVAETILHRFVNDGTDGKFPYASLIQATDGNFYGTTYAGGSSASNAGTVFQMTPDNTVTILYAFADAPDGASPYAAVIQATDGNFYGTTFGGGSPRAGVVYELSLGGLAPTTTTVASSSNPSTVSVWRSRRR